MTEHLQRVALASALTAVLAVPAPAAENAATLKDLTSVIALLAMPCGQVVAAERRGDNDYNATCSDGNRYRVFQTAEGRVTAQKQ